MIVTMLEGRVAAERQAELTDAFDAAGAALPPFIVESLLIHAADSDLWRIVTVWASEEALAEYRKAVDTPAGVRMFRSAGVEPTLANFDVVRHVAQA